MVPKKKSHTLSFTLLKRSAVVSRGEMGFASDMTSIISVSLGFGAYDKAFDEQRFIRFGVVMVLNLRHGCIFLEFVMVAKVEQNSVEKSYRSSGV